MKKIVLALLAFSLATATLHAQEIPSRPGDSTRLEKKGRKAYGVNLEKELGFSTEQSAKWDLISRQSRDKLGILNDDKTLSKDERKVQVKAIMKEQEQQLQEMLTPAQKEKLKELRKQRRQGRKEKKDN